MNRKTAQYQLTKRFMGIFLGILVIMNIFFVLAATTFVYDFLENKSKGVVSSLKKEQGRQTDWTYRIDNFVSKKNDDVLIIETNDGETIYSEKSYKIFDELYHGKSLPFLKHIIFSEESVYFVEQGEYDSFKFQLAISGETAMELAFGMFGISVILNIVAIILGSILIYFSVRRWSLKLSKMSSEISQIDISGKAELSVPEDPIEITEVAETFNHLLREQREAIAREKQFITNASHDLRTPLAAIRGHVQLIQRRGKEHPEVIPESIAFIDKESKRLEKLSNQLLVLEKEDITSQKEVFNLSEILLYEIEKIKLLYPQEFTFDFGKQIEFESYPGDLQQVFQNLIENAAKYSSDDSMIEIILKEEESRLIFSVKDQGIGISDVNKQHIFERFYRVDSSRTSKIEGSGIGLSIVKNISDKYKGKLTITDNKPKGTVFELCLPKMK